LLQKYSSSDVSIVLFIGEKIFTVTPWKTHRMTDCMHMQHQEENFVTKHLHTRLTISHWCEAVTTVSAWHTSDLKRVL